MDSLPLGACRRGAMTESRLKRQLDCEKIFVVLIVKIGLTFRRV
jgi:hypothetical protein